MLSKRQKKIILIMSDSKSWMVGKSLAKLLGVSDRTVRNDILAINNFYENVLIESNMRLGYKIDEYKLKSLNIRINEIIPQTSEERCAYIIKELLFGKRKINTILLQEEIFVSESSMNNDIKRIRSLLENYLSLKLIRRNNYIELIGDEEEKRILCKRLLSNETKGNFLNLNKLASLFKDFDLIKVKIILEEVLKEYGYNIRDIAIPGLMVHIGIAIERMIRYNFIKTDRCSRELKKSIEYEIAQRFFYKVESEVNIKIIEDEVVLLTLLLLGKRGDVCSNEIVKKKIDYSVEDLVLKIIENINKNFDIDFSRDNEFISGLEMHIASLLERHTKSIEIGNIYLQEIKRKYPFIFEIAVIVCKLIEEQMSIKIKEGEISFIALHLGAAYERANLKCKYKVVMIYPYNQTLSDLCIQKVMNRFSDRIEIIECMNFFEASAIESIKPDLILTTIPLEHNLDILTIEISLFVNNADENNMFKVLNRLDEIRYKDDFKFLALKLIKKEFFYTKIKAKNPTEIISKICDNLYDKGYVTCEFKEYVLHRESISGTSFVYGFSIPHSINGQAAVHSTISIAILDTPIKWGEFDVRFVILLAITEENRKILRIFFDWLSSMVSNSKKFEAILSVKSYEEFIEKILI